MEAVEKMAGDFKHALKFEEEIKKNLNRMNKIPLKKLSEKAGPKVGWIELSCGNFF